MRMILTLLNVSLSLALLSGLCLAQSPPSLEQIVQGLERYEKELFQHKDFLLRYARTKSEDVSPSMVSGEELRCEWTFARSGDKWFMEQRFLATSSSEGISLSKKPDTYVFKDGKLVNWQQNSNSLLVTRLGFGAPFYNKLLYTRNLSLDVPALLATSNEIDHATIRRHFPDDAALPFLPRFVRDNIKRYRVSATPEIIDGQTCWLVEWPQMDQFWVCPDRGFIVPRRIYHWGPGKPIRYEFVNKDYKEVQPGYWLPFSQVENKYASIIAEPSKIWGKVTGRSEYKLLEAKFGTVPESQFDVSLPKGTIVFDEIRNFKYTVEGTSDNDPFTAEVEKDRRLNL